MATILAPVIRRSIVRTAPSTFTRALSTLPNNEHIYVHEDPEAPSRRYILSYLSNAPPVSSLAIGTTTRVPPTTESFTGNPEFLSIVHHVVSQHAHEDPDVQAQAAMYSSQAGSALGSGGMFFPQQQQQRTARKSRQSGGGGGGGGGGDGAGGASSQGGMGGAGRGGYIHVSDQRNPPDFGRVAWPEDILGSLEIDGSGQFVDGTGRYQAAGTYRVITQEGILGLSPYLREKVVQRCRELDEAARRNG